MGTFSTLLLSSMPSNDMIGHVLSNAELIYVPKNVTFVFEASSTDIGQKATLLRFILVDGIRVFGFLYMLRYSIQFFGHINPYDGGLFEAVYTCTEPYSRMFLGFLPCLYGIDMGLIVGFLVLDRIESLLNNIYIVDLAGNIY